MKWENVSVFISSTFNDMHAERDMLLKRVFPELSEWCALRCLRLVDIDLRWGVTAADSHSRNTVDVCLRNVDLCRPFFLCFLGQRRGWVPQKDEISSQTFNDYPELTNRISKQAVTEMEIEHALLSPMQRMVSSKALTPEAVRNAVFFIRNGDYVRELNPAQQKIYTNSAEPDPVEAEHAHAVFVSRVRAASSRVFDYTCSFDRTQLSPELSAEEAGADAGRLKDFRVDESPLAAVVTEQLKRVILEAFPQREQPSLQGEPEAERDIQQRKLEQTLVGTIDHDIIPAEACWRKAARKPLIICGDSGSGKTTLLARMYQNSSTIRKSLRFCGISRDSLHWEDIWRNLLLEYGVEPPAGSEAFAHRFDEMLHQLVQQEPLLIILDGIDCLREGLRALSDLPSELPQGLQLALSFRSDLPDAGAYLRHAEAVGAAVVHRVSPMDAKTETPRLIQSFLRDYLKALDDNGIQSICENPASCNPLYLKVLLNELRVFGSYKQLDREIAAFGLSPQSAFVHLLERMELDTAYSALPPQVGVPRLLGLLCRARGRLDHDSLLDAFSLVMDERFSREALEDAMHLYLRQLRPYMEADGSNIRIAFDSLREACAARYAANSADDHTALARALEQTAPVETLYHLRMAGTRDALYAQSRDIACLCRCIRTSGALSLHRELHDCKDWADKEVCSVLSELYITLASHPECAAPLLYKELRAAELRNRAQALCVAPYLRYEPVCLPLPEDKRSGIPRAALSLEENLQSFALASKRGLAFLQKGADQAEVFSAKDGGVKSRMQLTGSVQKLLCTDDGECFAYVMQDNRLQVERLALAEDGAVMHRSPVCESECASVRFGTRCAFSGGGYILWQRTDGVVMRFSMYANAVEKLEAHDGRLVGAFGPLTVWKMDNGYFLENETGKRLPLSSPISDCIFMDGRYFLAPADRCLLVLDASVMALIQTIPMPEAISGMVDLGGRLLLADSNGALYIWSKTDGLTGGNRLSQDAHLDRGVKFMLLADGRIAFAAMQRIAVLEDGSGPQSVLLDYREEAGAPISYWLQGDRLLLMRGAELLLTLTRFAELGEQIRWYENLPLAWGGGTTAYAKEGVLHVGETEAALEERVAEIAFLPSAGTFFVLSQGGRLQQIGTDGKTLWQLSVAVGKTCQMHPCGKRMGILARRVYRGACALCSAVVEDVLTIVDMDGGVNERRFSLQEEPIRMLVYEAKSDTLLALRQSYAEAISCETPAQTERLPLSSAEMDIATGGVALSPYIFAVTNSNEIIASEISTGRQVAALPSHRRVTVLRDGLKRMLVIEGNEAVYHVFLEE